MLLNFGNSERELFPVVVALLQVENLREALAQKDSRWSATQVRTRDRLKQLEAENVGLKSQLADARRERQEAAKRRASLPNRPPSRVLDTKVGGATGLHRAQSYQHDLRPALRYSAENSF